MSGVRFSSKDGDTATVGQTRRTLDVAWTQSRPEIGRRLAMPPTEKGSAMPMIDALIPEGALKPEAEARLLKELTAAVVAPTWLA